MRFFLRVVIANKVALVLAIAWLVYNSLIGIKLVSSLWFFLGTLSLIYQIRKELAGGETILIIIYVYLLLALVGIFMCTKEYYKSFRNHIEEHGRCDQRYVKAMGCGPCPRAGLKLALEDTGVTIEKD